MGVVHSLEQAGLRLHTCLYRRTDGRLGHRLIGVPSLMLHVTGRRSGRPRTAVLTYARDGADYLVVASNDGLDRPPAWLLNVEANPAVEVQVARRRLPAHARIVERGDPDHARLWSLANAGNHGRYDGYQRRTSRPIPVVVLSPDERRDPG
jgi:F420H(2)-dependent quinone reductase